MEATRAAVHHRFATIDDRAMFYRESGPEDAPVVVLLHGYPASSFMFRDLIPLLGTKYRVIAPDHIGFGFSDAPTADEFEYTFAHLTELTARLLEHLGVTSYAMYVHDYGAPIGWRLALGNPSAVWGIVSQNGNAYEEGFIKEFWEPVWAYGKDPTPEREAMIRGTLELENIKWQYVYGVRDPSVISPDTWVHDHALVNRPGNDLAQLSLVRDYVNNVGLYPEVHEYFRTSQVPLLAVWGRDDGIFGPEGAAAFNMDLPHAQVHLLEGGHFLLETAAEQIASLMHLFLGSVKA